MAVPGLLTQQSRSATGSWAGTREAELTLAARPNPFSKLSAPQGLAKFGFV